MTGFADYGPSVDLTQIDDDVLGILRMWLPTYLTSQEIAREMPIRSLPRPADRSYVNALEEGTVLPRDDLLPVVRAVTASTADVPARDGGGMYSAGFRVFVYAFVKGSYDAATRRSAAMYAAAIRRCLIQQGGRGLCTVFDWNGESVLQADDDSSLGRNLAVGLVQFTVYAENLVTEFGGPTDPEPLPDPDEPYEDLPQITSVTTEVTAVPIDE